MLTDLNFLRVGQTFPPDDYDTKERLSRYAINKQIFENNHVNAYEQQFKRIERVIGNFGEVISYPVILNYQKLMSLKIGDLLFGEFPLIVAGDTESLEHEALEFIIEDNDLVNLLYESAIDVSRYGDSIINIYSDGANGKISISQPSLWLPVVSRDNLKVVTNHVIAWTYSDGDKYFLKAQTHYKGFYTEELFLLSKTLVGKFDIVSKINEQQFVTGLDDFAIIHISNVMTSDRCTGIDDYQDIDTIVSEILVRIGQISRVLDKHASPSVSGPSTALEKDPSSGEWRLKMGNYFPRDSVDEPNVEYITWDANLDSSFKQLEVLINALYVISEMGSILLGESDKQGNAISGTAMKLKMISPLAKVKRISKRFTPCIKKALRLCSQLGGVSLREAKIDIVWQDGIPADDKEVAEIITARTGNKATMSVKRALMQYDGMSSEKADSELALISEDEVMANPVSNTIIDGNLGDLEEDKTDGVEV
jgi:hypothetical protein